MPYTVGLLLIGILLGGLSRVLQTQSHWCAGRSSSPPARAMFPMSPRP